MSVSGGHIISMAGGAARFQGGSILQMAPIAEGLVPRAPTAAEGDPVPDRVRRSVGRDDGDAATDPEGAVLALRGVLDDGDRSLEPRLHRLAGGRVPDDKPARGAHAGLLDRRRPGLGVAGVLCQPPDAAGPHAEPGVGAEAFVVVEDERRAPVDPGAPEVGLVPGSLSADEVGGRVRPVAERRVLGSAAAAEGVMLLQGKGRRDTPVPAVTLVVVADLLDRQGHAAGDDLRTVRADDDTHPAALGPLFRFRH